MFLQSQQNCHNKPLWARWTTGKLSESYYTFKQWDWLFSPLRWVLVPKPQAPSASSQEKGQFEGAVAQKQPRGFLAATSSILELLARLSGGLVHQVKKPFTLVLRVVGGAQNAADKAVESVREKQAVCHEALVHVLRVLLVLFNPNVN